ncbi:hypothetical protein SAMN04487898_105132 [Pedobacter sp. ok626]|uniref:hypothetical protein n=1 Tax=Pedobacter sp. ok626 TaxID=1761882 RepID=UPI00088C4A9C|nr:hypothetical protein [Pedobacter sp. ok626]SDJ95070.1 hypothetical protein SAMN04487898_105132 [Pedobacter sp. ok626]
MKKITTVSVVALLCLNFGAIAQLHPRNITCKKDTVTSYKYGFSLFKTGYKSYTRITPSQFAGWRRIISYNQTLVELYAVALGAGNTFSNERVVIEVREPEKLNKKYCYELNVPAYLVDNMFVIMHQNLLYQYPKYVASVVCINGSAWLKITDKEEGILLNPMAKNENTTY